MGSSLLDFILALVLSGIVLLFGLRLFWLYVGITGFALGFVLGAVVAGSAATWILVVVGLGLGVVFAFLAILLQKPAAAIAGFVALGGTAVALLDVWVSLPDWASWVIFVGVGILGAIVAWKLFVPAVIVITSLSGAAGILNALESRLDWGDLVFLIIWVALFIAGLAFQFATRDPDDRLSPDRRGAPANPPR